MIDDAKGADADFARQLRCMFLGIVAMLSLISVILAHTARFSMALHIWRRIQPDFPSGQLVSMKTSQHASRVENGSLQVSLDQPLVRTEC